MEYPSVYGNEITNKNLPDLNQKLWEAGIGAIGKSKK